MTLTGSETLYVLATRSTGEPAATTELTTTGAIAALASSQGVGETTYTAITTAGAGTLTAAAIIGGGISRSGPVAAFTDTTDTAVNIVAAISAAFVGQSFYCDIKNLTAFTETLSAGSGVTISGATVIPPNSVGVYLFTLTSLTAVAMFHVMTVPLSNNTLTAITVLSTVGAGTITGAGIAGGVTSRTGSQSASPFTDTTDTAANIITAMNNARIGINWQYVYTNTTNATATLTGGTGVTVSGITSVPAGKSARFLVSYTAAATLTMVGFMSGEATAASAQDLILAGSTSGTTTLVASATAGSTTQTLPPVTGTTASTSGSNLFIADIKRCSAQTDATTTTLANVTGLTGQAIAVGTYDFEINLYGTCGGTGGWKVAFNYTTAVVSAINYSAFAYSGGNTIALTSGTTTTTQTSIIAANTAYTNARIVGTMTVTTAGTVDLQFAENSANSTSSIFVGSTMKFVRIA